MTPDEQDSVFNLNEIDDITFSSIVEKRFNESDSHWNSNNKNDQNRRLKEIRQDNKKIYLSQYIEEQLIDDRYEEVFNDNRQFVAVRTMVPFVTGQITAPEVTPANKDDLSKLFANDFESVLQQHAEKQFGKYKVRLAVQDLLVGTRVGILKWRYDGDKETIVLEHTAPESITIGRRSNLFEEPDYIRQVVKKTPGDLIRQFPTQKEKILELFGVVDSPETLDEKQYKIDEDWIWLNIDNKLVLAVGWSYQKYVFGKIKDPNFNENGKNITEHSMMPYVFFNLLNDGSGYIDQTSYAEQAKYSQKQYNKRGQVIAESARYGGTGVPIFAKSAITQKDAAKVHFSPVQRVLLDTADVNKSFTTWQQGNLPNYIVEDKAELKAAVDDTYGVNSISRGQQSDNKTATQDVLLRNQGEGRMVDLLDMIEVSMTRFYLLEAQLMYRYFTDTKYYDYVGDDGEFISIAISQKDIAKNIGLQINVKAGTSLPLDRAQKRATLMELMQSNKIGTLTLYRELGLFDDPEKAFKEYVEEQVNAMQLVQDSQNDDFDRDANEDLQIVLGGKMPKERDDISPEYVNFLNEWLLTDKYKLLQEKSPKKAALVSDWVDSVIEKGQRKATKMSLQPAPPPAPGIQPPPPVMPGQQPGQSPQQPETQAPTQPPPQAGMPSALPSAQTAVQ